MSTVGREVIGRCDYELLFADNKHPVDVCHVTLAAGAAHKKGEILEMLGDGKCDILGTSASGKSEDGGESAAGYILAEDADATDTEVIAVAYRSGHFVRNALLVKEGYTLTEQDEAALRHGGIYLSDAMI